MNTYYRIVSMVWVLAVAAWLAPLFAQTNEPNCGNNDPCGVTGMCTPCTNECTGELEECPEPDDSAGVNAFRMYTANAFRAVPDVQMWGGAGQHKLTWTRHANSRYDETAGYFGHGQNWRHSYQWEIADAGYDGYGRAIIQKKGEDRGSYGGVVCCGGKPISCVWRLPPGVNNAKAKEIVHECILWHENDHHDDIQCNGTDTYRPPFNVPGKDDAEEEKHAYSEEKECLKRSIGKCAGDAQCEEEIRKQIATL